MLVCDPSAGKEEAGDACALLIRQPNAVSVGSRISGRPCLKDKVELRWLLSSERLAPTCLLTGGGRHMGIDFDMTHGAVSLCSMCGALP